MRRIHTSLLSASLVLLVASPLFAQPPGPGRNGPRTPPGAAQLLGMEKVQEELKLTDDQKAAFTKITDKYKDDIAAAGQDREKRAEVRKKESAEVETAIPTVLKPDQVKRLKQLEVQVAGLQAFEKDDVASALKLTDDQKKAIKGAEDDLQKDVTDLFSNAGNGADRTQTMEKIRTLRTDALEKVVNGLTDEQKKTWKDLTGEKFEFPAPQRGNRPGANRRPRNNNPNASK